MVRVDISCVNPLVDMKSNSVDVVEDSVSRFSLKSPKIMAGSFRWRI